LYKEIVMSIETAKLELIQWIISLKKADWIEKVLAIKHSLEQKSPKPYKQDSKPTKLEEGMGAYKGKAWIADDFDEPLAVAIP
jgi:hypothetical protein